MIGSEWWKYFADSWLVIHSRLHLFFANYTNHLFINNFVWILAQWTFVPMIVFVCYAYPVFRFVMRTSCYLQSMWDTLHHFELRQTINTKWHGQIVSVCDALFKHATWQMSLLLFLRLDSPSLWSASIQPTWPNSHFDIRTCLLRYTCLLLLISMLWHRQAIFESKGDKLSSSAVCRIRTHQDLRHQIASRLNARWQTDWAIEDQPKNTWTRQPVPMISEHSAHLTPQPFGIRTWLWRYTCLLLISMLWHRQAIFESIERRQVVFLCWMQDANPSGSQTPNRQETECPLKNRLSYRGSS